jgi:hydroxyethylthiazole kinase-like uncharacterized protein yjeF
MEKSFKILLKKIPSPTASDNKYSRGYVIISGGGAEMSGAARLAAESALRAGAGIVKIACPRNALLTYARRITSVMAKTIVGVGDFTKLISDRKVDAVVIGPGHGVSRRTENFVRAALKANKNLVLDADALTVFQKKPNELFKLIKTSKGQVVLTPHEGEFKRLFKLGKNREEAVMDAANASGAVVVLKGSDTIMASPQGKAHINKNAPVNLATAGSGDVLAGIIAGLMAQKLNAFDAACAAVFIHSEAAKLAGRGMISEDLPGLIPEVLKQM